MPPSSFSFARTWRTLGRPENCACESVELVLDLAGADGDAAARPAGRVPVLAERRDDLRQHCRHGPDLRVGLRVDLSRAHRARARGPEVLRGRRGLLARAKRLHTLCDLRLYR